MQNQKEMRIMKRILSLMLIGAWAAGAGSAVPAAGPAAAGFQKLQSLAGEWEGKDNQGNMAKTNFKLLVSGTALMETLNISGMDEMVTLYSVDGKTIALMHYCPTGNQPRMRAVPPIGDVKELEFSFEGAGNLATPETGHQHKLVIQFQDHDHITEHWTWRSKGKDTEMVFHFTRKN
jgi:hypothetical protein